MPVKVLPCCRGGAFIASISWTSFGRMMHVTVRSPMAIRMPRSTSCRIGGGRGRHVHVRAGHVLEQRDQVDLLLVLRAQSGRRLLADDRQHRLMVHLGVVEPVEQVDGAGAGGGDADADLARELWHGRRP